MVITLYVVLFLFSLLLFPMGPFLVGLIGLIHAIIKASSKKSERKEPPKSPNTKEEQTRNGEP